MDSLKLVFLGFIIGIATAISLMVVINKGCNGGGDSQIVYVHDTTIETRYETQIQKDTVIKWFEKIVWREVKPEVVYYNTVDSIFIVKVQDLDVMLSVKKSGSDLYIYALNQNGKLLKQYVYKNVGNDFTATSQTGNIFVKSKLWYWDGVEPYVETKLGFKEIGKDFYKNLNYSIGVETGINFKNKADLRLGIGTNLTTGENSLKLRGSYRLW